MSAASPPSKRRTTGASLRDRMPLFAMLTADGLGLLGQGFAVCLLGAVIVAGETDAVLALASAGVVAVAALSNRRRLTGALTGAGLWRSSVAADGLAAVGIFAVLLHQNARADHPLVLVLGVAAAALGIAAQILLGPRTPANLALRAKVGPDALVRGWTRKRRRLRALSLAVAAAALVYVGPQAGWLAFACFVQAAEAVVVLVPFARPRDVVPEDA